MVKINFFQVWDVFVKKYSDKKNFDAQFVNKKNGYFVQRNQKQEEKIGQEMEIEDLEESAMNLLEVLRREYLKTFEKLYECQVYQELITDVLFKNVFSVPFEPFFWNDKNIFEDFKEIGKKMILKDDCCVIHSIPGDTFMLKTVFTFPFTKRNRKLLNNIQIMRKIAFIEKILKRENADYEFTCVLNIDKKIKQGQNDSVDFSENDNESVDSEEFESLNEAGSSQKEEGFMENCDYIFEPLNISDLLLKRFFCIQALMMKNIFVDITQTNYFHFKKNLNNSNFPTFFAIQKRANISESHEISEKMNNWSKTENDRTQRVAISIPVHEIGNDLRSLEAFEAKSFVNLSISKQKNQINEFLKVFHGKSQIPRKSSIIDDDDVDLNSISKQKNILVKNSNFHIETKSKLHFQEGISGNVSSNFLRRDIQEIPKNRMTSYFFKKIDLQKHEFGFDQNQRIEKLKDDSMKKISGFFVIDHKKKYIEILNYIISNKEKSVFIEYFKKILIMVLGSYPNDKIRITFRHKNDENVKSFFGGMKGLGFKYQKIVYDSSSQEIYVTFESTPSAYKTLYTTLPVGLNISLPIIINQNHRISVRMNSILSNEAGMFNKKVKKGNLIDIGLPYFFHFHEYLKSSDLKEFDCTRLFKKLSSRLLRCSNNMSKINSNLFKFKLFRDQVELKKKLSKIDFVKKAFLKSSKKVKNSMYSFMKYKQSFQISGCFPVKIKGISYLRISPSDKIAVFRLKGSDRSIVIVPTDEDQTFCYFSDVCGFEEFNHEKMHFELSTQIEVLFEKIDFTTLSRPKKPFYVRSFNVKVEVQFGSTYFHHEGFNCLISDIETVVNSFNFSIDAEPQPNGLVYELNEKSQVFQEKFVFGVLHTNIDRVFLHPTISMLINNNHFDPNEALLLPSENNY